MAESIREKVLRLANSDERIRAILLNGSRANPNIKPDRFQDYDLVFIVKEFDSFIKERKWLDSLGKIILQQLPDEMELGYEPKDSFTFLMIFEDQTRIDLTLFPFEKVKTGYIVDSLTRVWLDKDALFKDTPAPTDKDYHIKKPTQRQFSEVCNEFWWNSTNVAKGLKREELIYAKDILESVVRPVFWQ